jgi:hypothetical protein
MDKNGYIDFKVSPSSFLQNVNCVSVNDPCFQHGEFSKEGASHVTHRSFRVIKRVIVRGEIRAADWFVETRHNTCTEIASKYRSPRKFISTGGARSRDYWKFPRSVVYITRKKIRQQQGMRHNKVHGFIILASSKVRKIRRHIRLHAR